MKVFITQQIPDAAKDYLINEGHDVFIFEYDRPITKEELIDYGGDADAIISLLTDKIDKYVIDNLINCKIIANYAVGYNNIDVDYANSKGIIVTNTPGVLTNATADLAVTLILSVCRNVLAGERMMREKIFSGWKPKLLLGIGLDGKTIGIIGAGRIGQETGKRLKAFGTKILYYNNSIKKDFEKETKAKKVSLKELLMSSDVISIHLPLTDKTHHLLNEENLRLLKPKAVIVNTARGEIIDEEVLIEMLKEKKIFGAGFDVYENEPDINPKLLELDNVVLLPHLGSATFKTRDSMALLAAMNVCNVFNGEDPVFPVSS